jgi:hypothetical protein
MVRQGNYKGRPYSTSTALGRVMQYRGYENLYSFAHDVGISPRQLTKYLNQHEPMRPDHLEKCARVLDVDVALLGKAMGGERYATGQGPRSVP